MSTREAGVVWRRMFSRPPGPSPGRCPIWQQTAFSDSACCINVADLHQYITQPLPHMATRRRWAGRRVERAGETQSDGAAASQPRRRTGSPGRA